MFDFRQISPDVQQEPLKTKPMLRKAGLRSDPRCTLGELCARPSSEGAADLSIGMKGDHYWETIGKLPFSIGNYILVFFGF